MAPWVACYDWNKGSALVFGSKLVAVGPASKWNQSAILYSHVADLMRTAKEVLTGTCGGGGWSWVKVCCGIRMASG